MNALYLYFHGTNQVTLSGEGSSSVLVGCKYWPEKGVVEQSELGELVKESIDIRMEGAVGSIADKIKTISQFVELAGREPAEQDFVYLRYYDAGAGVDWKSRLVAGKVTLAGAGL